jgi:hypothetical protein
MRAWNPSPKSLGMMAYYPTVGLKPVNLWLRSGSCANHDFRVVLRLINPDNCRDALLIDTKQRKQNVIYLRSDNFLLIFLNK